ncbi:hypothetical protein [Capnocytophaga gingivalis]|uniref:Uncharacterized protein n=1 Tax=Capnocytophaga gingivalis TaxID=1017 RepID=A0ABU5Y5H3_9FLAO|nr:hypothetical protein [Capnocytophaga gingivalis]MEB3039177.1 hypothetical protein [Capnocytophaga gingivalis]
MENELYHIVLEKEGAYRPIALTAFQYELFKAFLGSLSNNTKGLLLLPEEFELKFKYGGKRGENARNEYTQMLNTEKEIAKPLL